MLSKIFKDFDIKNISFDSRKIKPNDAFFAIIGAKFNGNDFIAEAFNKGVKIVITDDKDSAKGNDKIFLVDDAKAALAEAAQILYPKLPKYLVAVTGTNGKSSVVSYFQQLAYFLGCQSASLGTLGLVCSRPQEDIEKLLEGEQSLTTLDPLSLRKVLYMLAENNIDYVAIEASSHGLAQKRLHGIKVKSAAFTSFSRDHLDYHKTMDNYLAAKLQLFTQNLSSEGTAIINSDNPEISFIIDFLHRHHIKFVTVGNNGDFEINSLSQSINRTEVNFTFLSKKYYVTTDIIGSFQVSNLLIAAGMLHNLGFPLEKIIAEIPKVRAVKGRLQKIIAPNTPMHIFVDYAHTPEALEKSLFELKKLKKSADNKLIAVFGCGGNRDNAKRPMMGKAAARLADYLIITDDNPRHEDPSIIRQDILRGCHEVVNLHPEPVSAPREILKPVQDDRSFPPEMLKKVKHDFLIEIPGRAEAIKYAIKIAEKDDIILIAGKGHEEYQIIGDKKVPFSDEQVVRSIL